jgi:hypothetical protein
MEPLIEKWYGYILNEVGPYVKEENFQEKLKQAFQSGFQQGLLAQKQFENL